MTSKTFVCLAASRKYGGYCLAGKEWAEGRLLKLLKIDLDDLFSTAEEQIAKAYDLQGEKIAYPLQEGDGSHGTD